tara:strand:+ start:1015 stop:1857 length:843 start_codon:yes stop_codon:yes gene_type:complete
MKNRAFSVVTATLFSLFTHDALAAGAKVDAEVMNPCVATAGTNGIISQTPASAACGATPQKYEITVVEMGVCKSHPYGVAKDAEAFDASSCSIVYSDTTPSATDVAALIGTSLGMDGESTLPPVGTYPYPYILMENQFITNTTFTAGDGTKWYGLANGQTNQTGPAADRTDVLANFGDTTCFSGYLGAAVSGAVIDGFITNSAKLRSAAGTADPCPNRTHLVGVLTLANPFTITPQTFGLNFQFLLTGQGTQFMSANGNDAIPEEYGSAPFSGIFTVLNP